MDPYMSQMVINPQPAQLDGEYSSFMTELGPDAQHSINLMYLELDPQQQSTEPTDVNPFVQNLIITNIRNGEKGMNPNRNEKDASSLIRQVLEANDIMHEQGVVTARRLRGTTHLHNPIHRA